MKENWLLKYGAFLVLSGCKLHLAYIINITSGEEIVEVDIEN